MIKDFYDKYSHVYIAHYVRGNARVDRQLAFFKNAIPALARSVLVIGCGSGEGAFHIADQVATKAEVRGIDLSGPGVAAGKRLFRHPRLELVEADVFADDLNRPGGWEVIVFPDSFEHLPRDRRAELAARLGSALAPNGRILFTIPTPGGQAHVAKRGELQEIDEPVTLGDLVELANAVQGDVTLFHIISIYETNDYAHAVIERGAGEVRSIREEDRVPLKVTAVPSMAWRARRLLRRAWRKVHVARTL
jgi:SAM-dependent methyltransferase